MRHYYTIHTVKTEEYDKEDAQQNLETHSSIFDEGDTDEETLEAVRDFLSEQYPNITPSLMYQDNADGTAREVGLIYTIEDTEPTPSDAEASRLSDWVTVREITSEEVSPSALGIKCAERDQ
jgi:hypothetical protein